MNNLHYDQNNNVYYNSNEDKNWIINQKHSQIVLPNQQKAVQWRQDLSNYLNHPYAKIPTSSFNKIDSTGVNRKYDLNINSFSTFHWKEIEGWKENLLCSIDTYLKKHVLIKAKRISVQFIGSLGSKDPIQYSDFDCIIIIPQIYQWSKTDLIELKALYTVMSYYARIFDPLQHHGIFLLTECEMRNNITPFYPPNLFRNAWGYGKNHCSLSYSANNYKYVGVNNFIKNNQYIRRLLYHKRYPNSLHSFKFILSSIFMMPVYFYNAKSIFYCKRKSIEEIIKLDDLVKSSFKVFSKIRYNWKRTPFPAFKNLIFKAGINYFSFEKLDLLNRRFEYHLRSNDKNPLIEKAPEIIRRANTVSNYMLNMLIQKH